MGAFAYLMRPRPIATSMYWKLQCGVSRLVLRASCSSQPLPKGHDAARAEEERGAYCHLRRRLHRHVGPWAGSRQLRHQLLSKEDLETYCEEIDSDDRDCGRLEAPGAAF